MLKDCGTSEAVRFKPEYTTEASVRKYSVITFPLLETVPKLYKLPVVALVRSASFVPLVPAPS